MPRKSPPACARRSAPSGSRETVRTPAPNSTQRFPVGYFGHRVTFAPDGVYGRWLLALPVAIMIDDTLFMHGGPSAVLAGLSLPEINLRYRTRAHRLSCRAWRRSRRRGSCCPRTTSASARRLPRSGWPPASTPTRPLKARETEAVRRFVAADRNPMIEADGPNWYRGAAMCNACAEADVLRPILAGLGARRLVIGHTVTPDARVVSRFDGTVIKLDTGMNHAVYRGRGFGARAREGCGAAIYADAPQSPVEIPAEGLYLSSATMHRGGRGLAPRARRGDGRRAARTGRAWTSSWPRTAARRTPCSSRPRMPRRRRSSRR